jgi:Zn-finger nucleic acid-binding protein
VPNCASCGALLHVEDDSGALACQHCGSREQLSAMARRVEVRGQSSRTCPACATSLAEGAIEGAPLLVCQRCEGMLIAMEHFVSVIDAVRVHESPARTIPPRRQSPGDRTLDCPACGRPMLSHFYGGPGNLVIDSCEACRLNWLDPGELRRIARAG